MQPGFAALFLCFCFDSEWACKEMSGMNSDGSAFQSHQPPIFNYSWRCSGQDAQLVHQDFTFFQAELDFVKETIMGTSLPVDVPCVLQIEKMSHSFAEGKAQEHIKNHSAVVLVPQMLSAQTMESWKDLMQIRHLLHVHLFLPMQSAFLQSLQREKLGQSWLEAHSPFQPHSPCLHFSMYWSPEVCKPDSIRAFQNHTIKTYVLLTFGCLFTWQRSQLW